MRKLQTIARLLLLFALLFVCWNGSAQELFGVGRFGTSTVSILRIDPVTGASTILLTTPAEFAFSAAYDPAGGRIFFRDGYDLYTANVRDLSLSRVQINRAVPSQLVYDTVGGQLLAVNSLIEVIRIDPATGSETILTYQATPIPGAQPGPVGIDTTGRRVFYHLGLFPYGNYFASQNFETGANTFRNVCWAGALLYNNLSGRLFATGVFASICSPQIPVSWGQPGIAEINVTTGQPTILFNGSVNGAALDESRELLFALRGAELLTFDLRNQTVTAAPTPIPDGPTRILFVGASTHVPADAPALGATALLAMAMALAALGYLASRF